MGTRPSFVGCLLCRFYRLGTLAQRFDTGLFVACRTIVGFHGWARGSVAVLPGRLSRWVRKNSPNGGRNQYWFRGSELMETAQSLTSLRPMLFSANGNGFGSK